MSYWSNNPELLDEITTKALPEQWRDLVESGEIDLYDIPEKVQDKAMMIAIEDYWGEKADEVKMRHKEGRLNP